MAARAISSATISFGLVSIPVKVYSTNLADSGIHFNLLHRECGSRLKQQYICPKDNVVVARDEMTKGYEFDKGRYVTFSDDELDSYEAAANKMLEIHEFVPLSKVDPLFYEKTYYLGPNEGGERPYRLLRAAMNETKRAAVARYAARGKQYIVLIRPFEEGLILQQLRYVDEIRGFDEVPLGEAEVKPQEIQLAVQLIDQISVEAFRPDKFEDEVKAKLRAAIDAKVAGQETVMAVPEEPKAQIVDLMEALKASLGQAKGTGGEEERKPAQKAPEKAASEKAGPKKRAKKA